MERPPDSDPSELADGHRSVGSGAAFLPQAELADLQRALTRARRRLASAQLDAPSERSATEWILDNDYLVRRALNQIRNEFPAGFQRRLPRLTGSRRPRALVLAEALLAAAPRGLDLEALESFLRTYQKTTPLSMAELWALPVLLRLALLRELRALVEGILAPLQGATEDPGTAAARTIRALRLLADIDVKAFFCRQSVTEQLLSQDPAGAYAAMDFETRDTYRRAVEEIAIAAGCEEVAIANAALRHARDAAPDGRRDHVGDWLVGAGRNELERAVRVRRRSLERRLRRWPRTVFFGIVATGQLSLLALVVGYVTWLRADWLMALLAAAICWVPTSVPVATTAHWILTRLLRPRALPKLDFSDGIPRRWRTLVVVPTLLGDEAEIDRLIEQLEIHYLTNSDAELSFALLTDHVDTREPVGPLHQGRLERASRGIRRLNSRYASSGRRPFHLLHRASRWNHGEERWMGWERKRGKLEELNRYLRGATDTTYSVHVGDAAALEGVAFVLTLDSDTQLPAGAAARLVGALAHPLNRPVFDAKGGVAAGYTVIQPRVEISPRSARRSPFTLLFAGDTGIDIYTRAVSEVYQDLFEEGIYVGKGIYDVDAFAQALDDRVPENSLLSHDLFEGVHGRVALATDVVVYEDYPPHYAAYLHRMHRWVRGDWQLLPWLAPRVPRGNGPRVASDLSLVDRYKIADNLRRSLLAPSLIALLVCGWCVLPGHPAVWTLLAVLAPGAGAMASLSRGGDLPRADLGRWFLALCFAAPEAVTVLDAIGRVVVRMLFTRKRMLEWTTAASAAKTLRSGRAALVRRLWAGPALAVLIAGVLVAFSPLTLAWAFPVLLLWVASPEIAFRISRPFAPRHEQTDEDARRYLRRIARRTWLFFETFVGPSDQWLPPDHYQEHPRGAAAHRTSPTNIGLLLLSQLSAYDLGYLGPDELSTWVANTLSGVERLERHRGHILNWYDTQTLEPLEPRYVSSVDSGNLAGALIALAEGCERIADDPPLRETQREGVLDTAELLDEAVEEWAAASSGIAAAEALDASRGLLEMLRAGTDDEGSLVVDFAMARDRLVDLESSLLGALRDGDSASHDPRLLRELRDWLERLEHQIDGAVGLARRLLPGPLSGSGARLRDIPAACARASRQLDDEEGREALDIAERDARSLCASLHDLAERARRLADGMELRFLYDPDRHLFHVGYDVGADRLDPHHYDLLASEARLVSFLAVMRREVPPRHWFQLGRPLVRNPVSGHTLMSWGGSMFEYLMPPLLMRSHRDTLLERSCEAAVVRQIEYGKENDAPWGISESGYAFLDGQKAYQYRSFGVPGLGLRRGLEEDMVVTPYATFLALPVRPAAVVDNLRALERIGMRGRYGFYEAADFHPERSEASRPGLVRSYMAHHHGMSLVALDNHLCEDVMVERFHADPRVRSMALLLDERAPRRGGVARPKPETSGSPDVALVPVAPTHGWEPDRSTMQIWALGNGTMTTFVSADGGGGCRWRDLALTRWQPDSATESQGPWIYVTDLDTGRTFGATPAPHGEWPDEGRVRFGAGVVEFRCRHDSLTLRLRIAVVAGEDVEVRELQIANESDRARRLRVVGCLEPVLAPLKDVGRHPVFSKLFLRCEPLEELGGFLVSRTTRDEAAEAPVLVHRLIGDEGMAPRPMEVDRGAFLGRGGSYAAPAALTREPGSPLAPGTLDPVCATEVDVPLAAGTSRSVAFVTGAAETRARALELGRRFGSTRGVRWALEDASRTAARRVARAGLPHELLPAAQRVLGALLCPGPALRAPVDVLEAARPSQRSLWGRGISGDEPIVLVRVRGAEDQLLLAELLFIHRYFRELGVTVDLVVVDDEPSGYGDEGTHALHRQLVEQGVQHRLHQRGGIHVVRSDQASGQEVLDLLAAAHVYLDARGGQLNAQLERLPELPVELPPFLPAGPPPGAPSDPDVAVEVPSTLELDNGVGGYDGDEYVIRPGASTPAPWCNVLANPSFGCLVSEAALGSSWSMNAGENRLTPWHNDPVRDPPSEVLYLRDEETGRCWSTTPLPMGLPTLVRHGAGHTRYEMACDGLEQTMTVFVPPELPAKIVRLRVRNAGDRPRRLTATYYAEWVLGARRDQTRLHVRSELAAQDSCLLARSSWSLEHGERVAFLATDHPLHGHTTDRVEMLGRGGDLAHPAALRRWGLSSRIAPGLDPCAVVQVHLDIAPHEEVHAHFFLGQAEGRDEALAVVRALRAEGGVEEAWSACRSYWDTLLDSVRVRTPDESLDRMLNRGLLYQSIASRFFGRTAFYQSSGAYGFRDQLQDSLALLHCEPSLARSHVLESAAHQFEEGDVLHWWHPPGGAGVRTRCSDDLLWLVYVTAAYVEATGDEAILEERVPFLQGAPLEPGEPARYGRFVTGTDGTLLEHCRRALSRGFTHGAHGLPLIGDGDWNDGMNRVGPEGRGESVWLGWFVHACVSRFANLVERVGRREEAARWRSTLPSLVTSLEEHGWDGAWYRRARHDDGSWIGSAHGAPPRIDSIAQSWAAISGAGAEDRVDAALAATDRLLVDEPERLVLLLAPPFGGGRPDAGYIAAYPAGVRENGGQYTHAAAWLGWAHAARGDGDAAYRVLRLLNPLLRTRTRVEIERYRVEPYVLAADVYSRSPFEGRGGWTWYTGAAAWMWRLGVEAVLGLRHEDGELVVDPCIPPEWPGFEAWVRRGELTIHVVVDNASGVGQDVRSSRLDGREVSHARVPLGGSGERRLDIELGALAHRAANIARAK